MAKFHLDYLRKRYPKTVFSGSNYAKLMEAILTHNSEKIANKTSQMTKESFKPLISKIGPGEEKRFILPDISDVLPKQSVFIKKGAEQGKLIRDTLRDALTKNLRDTLAEHHGKGLASMVAKRGSTAGRIQPDLIDSFQRAIESTFEGYTKRGIANGVPDNIHLIAIMEVRGTVNEIKDNYIARMIAVNPGYEVRVKWIHNDRLVKIPRQSHKVLDGTSVPYGESFRVPYIVLEKGKQVLKGIDYIRYPHSPDCPARQKFGCNCEAEYFIKKRKGL
jgi:hypothetical protein